MAQEAVNGIIQSLISAQDRAQRRRESEAQHAQRQKEFDASNQLAREQFENLKKNQALENARADAEQKAVAAFRKAQQLKMQQEIAGDIMKTGVMPLGSKMTSQTDILGGAAPEGVTPPELVQSQTFNIPEFGDVTLPGRQAWAQEQAGIERTLTAPETEAKLSVVNAQKESDFAKALMQKNWDDARARDNRKSQELIAAGRNAAMIAAANIRAAGTADADIDVTPYVQSGLEGTMSTEEINKLPLSRRAKMSIFQAISAAGGKSLSKDEMDVVADFKAVADTLRLYDEFLKTNPTRSNVLTAGMSGVWNTADPNITTPEKQLAGRASVIARSLAREKGTLSNPDIVRAQEGYLPSRYSPAQANIKKRDDLLRDIISAVDAKLQAIPDKQRAIIKKKVGLLDFGFINKKTNKSQPSTTNGSTEQVTEYDYDPATKTLKPRAAGVK